ncbi:MAG: 2-amino-4-hydroxy-6-hydroxymethyldihydropteridine diphosphokinase [Elusimicrobiota bacterium]|nr:2-amino-4-hydroxy-6-hydroxymethyldihydropteridine diphosphokinase [Elusimicrobiota bacterium]
MVIAYIGVGSNIGNRKKNILLAKELLENQQKIKIVMCSSIYETAPWGYKNQPKFLNAVWKIKTELSPEELLKLLKSIEKKLGRTQTVRWGPRKIDLDILFYGNRKLNKKNLKIPHPEIFNRDFVLKPLYEIAPKLVKSVTAGAFQ